ncbi:hypothetical protein [Paracoccus angustae]|uniref:hypothetical protein n=1 Tax=Paracoccus angustae TaxID=1671480 RepID=UPI003671C8B8
MLSQKIALIIFLGSASLQFVHVVAVIHLMGPLPERYDPEWTSRMFKGRIGKLVAIATCNALIAFVALAVFALSQHR